MVAYKDSPLNLEEAHNFVTARGAMIMCGAPRELSNPREAGLIAVPEGKEFGLHEEGYTRTRDLIAIAFRPGHESDGPSNIAVYERLNNQISIKAHCSAWYSPNPRLFMIASREEEIGYCYSDARLVRIAPVPRADFDLRLRLGKSELQRAAGVAKKNKPSHFMRH